MIAKLTGLIDEVGEGWVILNVNNVGYLVFCSQKLINESLSKFSEQTLYIETHVREDHFHLYGFESFIEQQWFKILLSVQGVGAKVALAIQSQFKNYELSKLIINQERDLLTSVPGIGAKLAQRIVNELKDKIPSDLISQNSLDTTDNESFDKDINSAESALINLGFKKKNVDYVLSKLIKEKESKDLEFLIKESLKMLNSLSEAK
tara:strand:+ start:940 stop:1557 length:618 start_codon:yes stop_codon:yes gene_type:complete